ncbi:MAG: decaprenyl-phosphate phosphoribosyltransferase [Actinobacteria bacterium]|nr:decaprenyl-phosphate phosphoribosyltransferase [Actinomycetota bacterium]
MTEGTHSHGVGKPGDPPAAPVLPATWRSLVREARPKQWTKNVLVFAAPAAAGVLTEWDHFLQTLVAFVAFCLAASGTYFFNDALDAHADRLHPSKRFRPIAAGHISERAGKAWAAVLVVAGILVALPVRDGQLAVVVAGYVALTMSYSAWLKHEPVIDLGVVAAGFVIRAIAGGVATGVHISDWFLIVAGGASLFMVTGKRYAEQIEMGDAGGAHRSPLTAYTRGYLSFVRAVAAGVTITAYCLWAFENAAQVGSQTWFEISIVPFVLAILRYAHVVEQGGGGAPEDVVLNDRMIQVLGVLWAATFAVGVHI